MLDAWKGPIFATDGMVPDTVSTVSLFAILGSCITHQLYRHIYALCVHGQWECEDTLRRVDLVKNYYRWFAISQPFSTWSTNRDMASSIPG